MGWTFPDSYEPWLIFIALLIVFVGITSYLLVRRLKHSRQQSIPLEAIAINDEPASPVSELPATPTPVRRSLPQLASLDALDVTLTPNPYCGEGCLTGTSVYGTSNVMVVRRLLFEQGDSQALSRELELCHALIHPSIAYPFAMMDSPICCHLVYKVACIKADMYIDLFDRRYACLGSVERVAVTCVGSLPSA